MNADNKVIHNFDAIYDKNSKILILGTMPSVKSRAANFFYMNPQNLFWRIITEVLGAEYPETIGDKTQLLLSNGIAVWDVLKSCEIEGSLDSTIKNPVPNDFSHIFETARIKAVFTNGTKATGLYKRFCSKTIGLESIYLPSTSPANRKSYTYATILDEWRKILAYL